MDKKSLVIGILLATIFFLATGFSGGKGSYEAFATGKGYAILNCETGVLKTFIPAEKNRFFTVEINYEKESFTRKLGQVHNMKE
ncbi:MAG: hypothetical protein JXO49_00970 [Deltaproteobacteria bacterium]|nr:hypothetical protein [Candidatus Anaeroferrophillus wilburensis]MBN2887898.1 hypothetical protein [Deltaproteobacteria bacterium]